LPVLPVPPPVFCEPPWFVPAPPPTLAEPASPPLPFEPPPSAPPAVPAALTPGSVPEPQPIETNKGNTKSDEERMKPPWRRTDDASPGHQYSQFSTLLERARQNALWDMYREVSEP
jgi:hypothetical protein